MVNVSYFKRGYFDLLIDIKIIYSLTWINKFYWFMNTNQISLILDNKNTSKMFRIFKWGNGIVHLFPIPAVPIIIIQLITFFGSLKRKVPVSKNTWMRNNPDRSITICSISIVKDFWSWAVVANIRKSFEDTAIILCKPNNFINTDFDASTETNRPKLNSANFRLGPQCHARNK